MTARPGILVTAMLAGVLLLFNCQPARAEAIALSDITASNLMIADRGLGVIKFDPLFGTLALAHAQNSLGDLNDQADSETAIAATTSASVTWANGNSLSSGTSAGAASNAHVPGSGAANSAGQALVFAQFGVSCPTCVGSTTVDFSVDLRGNLEVLTDVFGQLARSETIFNLLVNGDTVLFRDDLLSIASKDHQLLSFATTLTGSMTLDYATPYDLTVRTDSESEVISTVPEPATMTLLCLGVGALGAARARRRSRRQDPVKFDE